MHTIYIQQFVLNEEQNVIGLTINRLASSSLGIQDGKLILIGLPQRFDNVLRAYAKHNKKKITFDSYAYVYYVDRL